MIFFVWRWKSCNPRLRGSWQVRVGCRGDFLNSKPHNHASFRCSSCSSCPLFSSPSQHASFPFAPRACCGALPETRRGNPPPIPGWLPPLGRHAFVVFSSFFPSDFPWCRKLQVMHAAVDTSKRFVNTALCLQTTLTSVTTLESTLQHSSLNYHIYSLRKERKQEAKKATKQAAKPASKQEAQHKAKQQAKNGIARLCQQAPHTPLQHVLLVSWIWDQASRPSGKVPEMGCEGASQGEQTGPARKFRV